MGDTKSITAEVRGVARSFRDKINLSEDRVDLMNNFSMAAIEIVKKSIKGGADIRLDDITLDVDSSKGVRYSDRINKIPEFRELLEGTDLESQIVHLAEAAKHRYIHMAKHREKTNLKIR
ncbi:MAG TPA: hypothetical protein PK358_07710 [Spirochaetota bacterium]|nr:hypothetical protein [Spirochaetota bacterium]HPJ34705.1 hypothetical protein [Spirochaetota bacterium]